MDTRWTGPLAGCTAVAAVVAGAELVVANAGDSRCVASRAGAALAMTEDHKPNDQAEHARILKVLAPTRLRGPPSLFAPCRGALPTPPTSRSRCSLPRQGPGWGPATARC